MIVCDCGSGVRTSYCFLRNCRNDALFFIMLYDNNVLADS